MSHSGQQISWSRQDTWTLKMPPVCALTGRLADTAIILNVGHIDLILPVTAKVRAEHDRLFGALRTARRLRPSMRGDIVTLHNASCEFVAQLLKINGPGTVYVGGLYPLEASRPHQSWTAMIKEKAA